MKSPLLPTPMILAAVTFKSEANDALLLRKLRLTALDNAQAVFYSSRSPFRL